MHPDLKDGHGKSKPVSCGSIMGAMGGPGSGHLLVSQVPLTEGSAVGQLNSLPVISQTGAKSPGQEERRCSVGSI